MDSVFEGLILVMSIIKASATALEHFTFLQLTGYVLKLSNPVSNSYAEFITAYLYYQKLIQEMQIMISWSIPNP